MCPFNMVKFHGYVSSPEGLHGISMGSLWDSKNPMKNEGHILNEMGVEKGLGSIHGLFHGMTHGIMTGLSMGLSNGVYE